MKARYPVMNDQEKRVQGTARDMPNEGMHARGGNRQERNPNDEPLVPPIWLISELVTLADQIPHRPTATKLHAQLMLVTNTALRDSECRGLLWSDFNFDMPAVAVKRRANRAGGVESLKGRGKREIP